MKTLSTFKHLSVLAVALLVSLAACSSVNNDTDEITEADLELAAQIVGTSLADDESGMMSSMYDTFSDIDAQSISYGGNARFKNNGDRGNERSGRGGEHNFTHEYDSLTGVHTISFERSVENDRFQKSISVEQKIIFTDPDGEFIARPKENKEAIETISFTGSKSGTSESPYRSSNFTKIDSFFVAGLHSTSTTLSIDGTHNGTGEMEGTRRDSSTISGSFEVSIAFENVEVNKDTVLAYGNLENGVSGTLTYSINMIKTVDGVPEEKIVEGTIDLEEDGTALMRFNKFPKVFRLSLLDGEESNGQGDRRRHR